MKFYPETEKYLRESGWHPGRKYIIDFIQEHLVTKGYETNDRVIDFLTEFGGLIIRYPYIIEKDLNITREIDLCVINAVDHIFHENVILYEERCNDKLVVVGMRGDLTLLMSPKGIIYGGFDELLYHIGDSTIEAFNKMIMCEKLQEME